MSNEGGVLTKQTKIVIGILMILGVGAGFGVKFGPLPAQVADHETRLDSIEQNVAASAALARFILCRDILERPEQNCKRAFIQELAKVEAATVRSLSINEED